MSNEISYFGDQVREPSNELPSETIKRLYPEDYEIAEKLYETESERMYKEGYAGDFGLGFDFALDTYGPMCWLEFFAGANAETIRKQFCP